MTSLSQDASLKIEMKDLLPLEGTGSRKIMIVTPFMRDLMFNMIDGTTEHERADLVLLSTKLKKAQWLNRIGSLWLEPCSCFNNQPIRFPDGFEYVAHCSIRHKGNVNGPRLLLQLPTQDLGAMASFLEQAHSAQYYSLTPSEVGWTDLAQKCGLLELQTWLMNISEYFPTRASTAEAYKILTSTASLTRGTRCIKPDAVDIH